MSMPPPPGTPALHWVMAGVFWLISIILLWGGAGAQGKAWRILVLSITSALLLALVIMWEVLRWETLRYKWDLIWVYPILMVAEGIVALRCLTQKEIRSDAVCAESKRN